MKGIFKRLAAMTLAFSLAITLTPISTFAAEKGSYGKVVKASSGNVYTILYPGAKPKKARFSIEYNLVEDTTNNNVDDFMERRSYEVTIRINRTNLTKSEIVNAVNEMKRKNSNLNDYYPLILDGEGDRAINLAITGGFNAKLSSAPKKQIAKTKKGNYWINNWRKETVYKYKLMVPADHESVYVGVAGLRNGLPTKANYKSLNENRINFYQAGYGNTRGGYAYVTKVHSQVK